MHNLIALGSLAKKLALREYLMSRFYQPDPFGAARVVTVSEERLTALSRSGPRLQNSSKRILASEMVSMPTQLSATKKHV